MKKQRVQESKKYCMPRSFKRGVAKLLSISMIAGSLSMTGGINAEAGQLMSLEEWEQTISGNSVSANYSVSANEAALYVTPTFETADYAAFITDQLMYSFQFGSDVKKQHVYGTWVDADLQKAVNVGFSDVEYNAEAPGWVGGVYQPRQLSKSEPGAAYVEDGDGYLAISSKVWTETESTGYGVYTYENTSTFDMELDNADYKVEVTLMNPTSAAYSAYIEAEDITKVSATEIPAGQSRNFSFEAVLIDGILNLKFPVGSTAAGIDAAAMQTAYVSSVKVTRLATEEAGSKPTVFVASDSTVQSYEVGEYPKTGWGQTLHQFFGELVEERECEDAGYTQCQTYETENVIVENRAIGGRSSKSFVEEGKLDDLLEDVKPGDYLLVQWGHNDATASRPNRYVSADDFEEWLSYYVFGALQRGATPVLVTPVARYSQTGGVFNISFGNYRQVMFDMADKYDIPVVDLGKKSTDLATSFGEEGAKSLFMKFGAGEYENYPSGSNDDTHLQYYGAYKFAQCLATGIQENDKLADLASKIAVTLPEKVPAKIANLKITTVGASSVTMTWDKDADAELYYIYRHVLAAGEKAETVVITEEDRYSATSNNVYTDSNCKSGNTYVYAVKGFNELGTGTLSDTVSAKTKEAGLKFDFEGYDSNKTEPSSYATQSGWTHVGQNDMYGDWDTSYKYGWITKPGNGRDRGEYSGYADADTTIRDMYRDFVLGVGEFAVQIPNGDYEVTMYSGDITGSSQKTTYTAEGLAMGTASSSKSVGSVTNIVRVEDGQLNVVSSGHNYTNGMTVTELQLAPSGLNAFEFNIGDFNSTFQLGFVGLDNAASYTIYLKNSTDAKFTAYKTFTAEEWKADSLSCGAVSGDTGEVYQCYVRATLADGSETAASETITVELVTEGTKPAAPANVICVSPTVDATELQREITIAWDAVPGATKYVIYRYDKAEGDKGYQPDSFVKVGESREASFTDINDVTTNVPYYYRVAAFARTGRGDLSEICKSNVSGKLIPSSPEKYADRALVAINLAGADGGETLVSATDAEGNEYTAGIYLSWRSFAADFDADNNLVTTFTVYKNGSPLAGAQNLKVTNLIDPAGTANDVYSVVGSTDGAQSLHAVDTTPWANKYQEMTLFAPADEIMPDGKTCTYSANDMSVGDLDGDGDLELIVKWYPSNAQDNSGSGYTGKTFLDGYDVNFATGKASLLWRIDLGVNIRSGAHYTQFQVWDFDGDKKAEIAVKTADGTTTYKSTDGTAAGLEETNHVGKCNTDALPTDTVSAENDYRNTSGYILDGPEYLTMFNGEDGTIASTADYVPARGVVSAWGDGNGNRVDRFLSATAYLDGETPFAVFCRGYYTRTCLTAYYMKDTDDDKIGDTLTVYWNFDTNEIGTQYEAQGNHGLSVNDIDNDGKDEIIYGSLAVDHNGSLKWSTGLGHGDAMHVSDWVSSNPGLEVMQVHEHDNAAYHVEMHDAETGEILMGYYTGKDTGRGVAADIDPTAEGGEWWSIASPTYESNDEPEWDSTNGEVYASQSTLTNLIKLSNSTPASNFSIFWDGDLLSEIQDHTFNNKNGAYDPIGSLISKWNYETQQQERLLYSEEIWSNNGTKGNMGLVADVLGDWREEIITRTSRDKNIVRIYSTTIETDYVVPCLLENLAYREGVAWQNVGYNQPANTSYLLSQGLVTAQLSDAETSFDYAQFNLTPANDGDLYGHEVTGYEIYRAEGDGEYAKIDTVKTSELGTLGGSDTPAAPEIIGWEDGEVVGKYDFGNKNGTGNGFTDVSTVPYSSATGYGITTEVSAVTYNQVGVTIVPAGDTETDVEKACTDLARAGETLGFAVDVPAGKYRVEVYAGAGYSNNAYNNSAVAVNSTDLGTVSRSTSIADIVKTAEVTLDEAGQITVTATNQGNLAILNAVVITKLEPVYAEVEEPVVKTELQTIFEENFEDGSNDSFVLNTSGYADNEYLEKDTSTVNANASNFVYGVGARAGGDTGTTSVALGIDENVTVSFDVKMDGCNQNKSSNFALLGSENTVNWLSSEQQILTISASADGNGYWGSITVNGVDITTKANVENGTTNGESSGKGLTRDTTGWLRVTAALDFAKQTMDIKMTRISNGSVVYENEALEFVNQVTKLDRIYMAAGKVYGGVFTDNILIQKEVPVVEETPATDYVYKDTTVAANTTYSYKVAAVVSYEESAGNTVSRVSHRSAPITAKTLIEVGEVADFTLPVLVEGTPLADGQTVADLLPQTVDVTDTEGNELKADVTWDVTAVNLNTVGKYKVIATVAGWATPIEKELTVEANKIKGYAAIDDIVVIQGMTAELPAKVTVEYTNTTTEEVDVEWDAASLDTSKLGTYSITGTLQTEVTGLSTNPSVTVRVIANYIASVPKTYCDVDLNAENAVTAMPAKVTVIWANGTSTQENVTWTDTTAVNTTVLGDYAAAGSVEGFETAVEASVHVSYPVVKRFDFGISEAKKAEGWTTVTVNVKGGTTNISTLGALYDAEKGYGFTTDGTMDGRIEEFDFEGRLPYNVYTDFALPAGNTFAVDVANGKYLVEIGGGSTAGSSKVAAQVEGKDLTVSSGKNSYAIGTVEVQVTDGQMSILFTTGNVSRMNAIVIRAIEIDAPVTSATPSPETSATPNPETSATPSPETSATPKPETSETPSPETSETPSPETSATPSPETSETPSPETSETPSPESGATTDENDDGGEDIVTAPDWSQIASGLMSQAETAQNVNNVVMNVVTGSNIQAPAGILQTVRNAKATLAMHTGNKLTFSISSKDITYNALRKGINLTVSQDSNAIPQSLLQQKATGSAETRVVAMNTRESFGMVVNMHFTLGSENAGKAANLYRYDEQTKKLRYMGKFTITDKGQAVFGITNGAIYMVTVTDIARAEAEEGYIVKKSDTLSAIAAKNKMKVADLIRLNPQIADINKIRVGQKIFIR